MIPRELAVGVGKMRPKAGVGFSVCNGEAWTTEKNLLPVTVWLGVSLIQTSP